MYGDPAVTVVIPTHNRRDLLLRTLHSVLKQADVSLEVVVVDDGSHDGSADVVRDLADPRIRVLRHETAKGVSAARNAGLVAAAASWVAFLDDDDLWAPEKLAAQLAAVTAADAVWSCVDALHVDGDLQVFACVRTPPASNVVNLLRERNPVPGGGSGVLVRTDLARRLGGFDEDFSIVADWDFYLRVSREGSLAVVDRPLLAYYVHSDSMVHNAERYLDEVRHLQAKYHNHPDIRPRIHQGTWASELAWMALGAGQYGTAAKLLARAVVTGAARTVLRGVMSRIRGRLIRREPAMSVQESSIDWLSALRPRGQAPPTAINP